MPTIHFTLTDEQYAKIPHRGYSIHQLIKTHVIDTLQLGGSDLHFNRTSKETQDAIIAAYDTGSSVDYIAHSYSLTRQGVYKILQRHNKSPGKCKIHSITRLEINDAFMSGQTIEHLMSTHSLSASTVRNIIKSFNPTAFKSDSRNSEIINARQSGATVKELVERFKISESQIRNILRGD